MEMSLHVETTLVRIFSVVSTNDYEKSLGKDIFEALELLFYSITMNGESFKKKKETETP